MIKLFLVIIHAIALHFIFTLFYIIFTFFTFSLFSYHLKLQRQLVMFHLLLLLVQATEMVLLWFKMEHLGLMILHQFHA